jgi:hypothetical protein
VKIFLELLEKSLNFAPIRKYNFINNYKGEKTMKKIKTLVTALLLTTAMGAMADNDIVVTQNADGSIEFVMPQGKVELDLAIDDATSVKVVIENGEVKSTTWYDLQGRPLPAAPNQAGIYVKDGKVVIVKN